MTVLIIYSGGKGLEIKREFALDFDDKYASRFIKHLQDDRTLCTGCGEDCDMCRLDFDLDYSENIKTLQLPKTLPFFIDNVQEIIGKKLPNHDVLITINVHEDILLALPQLSKNSGGKAMIVPLEHPDWITKWARSQIRKTCGELGMDSAFPKPFCSLKKGSGKFIDSFIEEFRVGYPQLDIEVNNENEIVSAIVNICAPCGNTYFVAKNLIGKKADDDINKWVAKYWHSFPCVASMKMDPELGDTILHKGGYIHYDAVNESINSIKKNKSGAA